jgi:PAS domain S-box-containing protein
MALSPQRRGSLGRTLLIACLLLALGPLIGISALTTRRQYEQSRDQIIQQLTSVARLKEAEVHTWFRSLTPDLELLAADPRIHAGLAGPANPWLDEASEAMQGALRASDTFDELILLDLDGRVLASTDPGRAGQSYETQPFVLAGARAPYVQTPFYSLAYDQMIVFAAAPLRDGRGLARGILAGVTTLNTLDQIMLERAGLGETGETYLVSSDHIMLTEPRAAEPRAKPFGAVRTHGANQALAQINGSALYDNYEYPAVPVVGVYTWIPELRVALLAEQSQAEAFATAWQNIWLTLGITLLTALITALAAIGITRGIAQPIAQLTSGAARVAQGDLAPMAPIARNDEIGTLAAAFNTMTAQVRELIEGLEGRVAARTRELEAQKEALLRSEQKLLLHMQQTPLAAMEWNLDLELTEWNPAAETIFGYRRAEAIGKNALDLVVPDSARAYVAALLSDLVARGEGRSSTNENITKDGRIIVCEWYNTPLIDQNGAVIGVAALAQDITERQRAQEAMLHRQKLESLGVLAGGIAHDFNNLLMGVLGYAELARYDLPADSPALHSVKQIELAARRAADLTGQMLAYSGKGQFVIQPVDLNTIVKEIPQLLHVSIAKGVRLTYNFGSHLPAIEADAAQIRQVVMNLVINASEAIGETSGEITISTGVVQVTQGYLANTYLAPELRAGKYVFLEVTDTGCGMDAATQAKIFEPFFTTKFTGRGLGLAALLGIVRGHGGTLKVSSKPGQGSTFLILLPSAGALARVAEQAPPPALPCSQETVLVVDDEDSVRAVTARALERLGFGVLLAQNGHEGIDLFRTHTDSIGCVLLDLTMPVIGGEQVFQEIRRMKPDAQIVLMSGYSLDDATSRFGLEGLVGFLQKPFSSAELHEALQKVLRVV